MPKQDTKKNRKEARRSVSRNTGTGYFKKRSATTGRSITPKSLFRDRVISHQTVDLNFHPAELQKAVDVANNGAALNRAAALLKSWREEDQRENRDQDELAAVLNEGRPTGRRLFDE